MIKNNVKAFASDVKEKVIGRGFEQRRSIDQ